MASLRLLLLAVFVFFPALGLPFPLVGEFEFNANQGSRFCLGCHDGLLTGQARVDHPIEVDYARAQVKSRGALRHASQLDPAIKLENGRVGCVSCHGRNSTLAAKLVMNNFKSQLCLSCHNF